VKDGVIVGRIDAGAEAGKREDADVGGEGEGVPPFIKMLTYREQATGSRIGRRPRGGRGYRQPVPGRGLGPGQAMSAQAPRAEFSGQVRLTVLGHTPAHVREQIPRLEEHLRGIINEMQLSTVSGTPVSLTVHYQRDLLSGL
jgi:hypothetical protein